MMFSEFAPKTAGLRFGYMRNAKNILKSIAKKLGFISNKRTFVFSRISLLITSAMFSLNSSSLAYAATLDSSENKVVSTSTLSKKPSEKTTIGVVPYFTKDHQIYLLLGRERIDGHKKEKAGKFSDFGGSVKLDGTTLMQNAIRELQEESLGQIILGEEDLLKKGVVLFKRSPENREIFYILYSMSEQEYKISRRLNALWPVLCQHKPEDNYCEKDQFLWINAKDLMKNKDSKDKATHVRSIDGKQHALLLRGFFVRDCLNHPDFLKFLDKLNCAQDNPKIFIK